MNNIQEKIKMLNDLSCQGIISHFRIIEGLPTEKISEKTDMSIERIKKLESKVIFICEDCHEIKEVSADSSNGERWIEHIKEHGIDRCIDCIDKNIPSAPSESFSFSPQERIYDILEELKKTVNSVIKEKLRPELSKVSERKRFWMEKRIRGMVSCMYGLIGMNQEFPDDWSSDDPLTDRERSEEEERMIKERNESLYEF